MIKGDEGGAGLEKMGKMSVFFFPLQGLGVLKKDWRGWSKQDGNTQG